MTSGKGDRKNAQQRLVAQREAAAAARAAAAQRKKLAIAVIPVAVVIIVVASLVIVKLSGGGSTPKASTTVSASAAPTDVVGQATSVPLSALNAVGLGSVSAIPVSAGDAPALTVNGLPRVFYAGGEFCPFCAAERWGVVVALSRFGTWSGLGQTESSSSDIYPNTATFSFHGATFTGTAVAFSGYELTDRNKAPLDTLDAADQALMSKYDGPPYFPSDSAGSIPFIDIGGKYLISGASYNPQVLAGKDQAQIAAALSDPSSTIAKAVLGTANVITAAICKATGGTPAAVCTSAGVVAAAAKLPSA